MPMPSACSALPRGVKCENVTGAVENGGAMSHVIPRTYQLANLTTYQFTSLPVYQFTTFPRN